MHEQWQDMIPFYIAGSLSGAEAGALERHLADCEVCRREAEEWGIIADAVRAEAESWAKPPPLALEVRAQLHGSANGARREALPPAHPYHRRSARSPWRLSMTLAAVVAVLLLFGGLLVFMALRGVLEQDPEYASSSPVVPTLTASPVPSSTYTPGRDEQDLGILPPSPSSTLRPRTPVPTARLPATAALQGTVPNICYAVNTSGGLAPLHRWPDETSEQSGTLVAGESRRTWVYSANDWYQVGKPSGGIAGWVRGDLIALQGDCAGRLLLPSPTAAGTPTLLPSPAGAEQTATPDGTCQPDFYRNDADRERCPTQTQTSVQAAYQPFEGGLMLWRDDTGGIWVLTNAGTVLHYEEANYGTRPDNPVTETPPEGQHKPISGFGRVWGNYERARNALGWATVPERGYTMTVQGGHSSGYTAYFYMTLPDGRVVQIHDNMTWNLAE